MGTSMKNLLSLQSVTRNLMATLKNNIRGGLQKMKNLKTIRMALAVAVVFLLGVGGAQAQMVRLDPMDDTIAIGIDNLIVNGTPYNVTFPLTLPAFQYGVPPVFDFHTEATARDATDAVNAALNNVPTVTRVRDSDLHLPIPTSFFLIGYEFDLFGLRTLSWNGDYTDGMWVTDRIFSAAVVNVQTWASFEVVPEPGTGLLLGLGLAGVAACTRRSGQWLVWP